MEIIRGFLWKGVKIVLTITLLFLALKDVNFISILDTIKNSNINLLVLSYVIALSTPVFNSLRIKILTDKHGMSLSLWDIVNINYVSLFYSLIVPSSLTVSAVRYYRLSKSEKKSAEIIGALSYLKVLSLFVIFTIAIIFFDRNIVPQYYRSVGITILIVYIMLLFLIYSLFTRDGFRLFYKLRSSLVMLRAPYSVKKYIDKVLQSVELLNSLSSAKKFQLVFLTLLYYTAGFVSFFLIARAVFVFVDINSLISIRSLSLIVTSIPVSVGGFGLREGSFLILFKPFAIDASRIIALSFLLFGRTLVFGIFGGFLELLNTVRTESKDSHTGKI